MLPRLRHQLHQRLVRTLERRVDAALARHVAAQREHLDHRLDTLSDQWRGEVAELRDALHAREVRDRRDLLAAGERAAVASSAAFMAEAMPAARTYPTPAETLAYALKLAPTGGLALEFGVYSGATLARIAAARGGAGVYGFDSFAGLPEPWRAGFTTGAFALETPPEVPGAELVVGWFADTLPGFLTTHPDPIDLVHLDADLYSATAAVLAHAGPRLHPGSVIVFDEYFNYPGWQRGEHQAWTEYATRTGTSFRYEAFTHDHEQVVIVIDTPPRT